jgi:hypothetical protein
MIDTLSSSKTRMSFSNIPGGGGSPFDVASVARNFPCSGSLSCFCAKPNRETQTKTTSTEVRRSFMTAGYCKQARDTKPG